MNDAPIWWAIHRLRVPPHVELEDLLQIGREAVLRDPEANPATAALRRMIDYLRAERVRYRVEIAFATLTSQADAVVAFNEVAIEERLAAARRRAGRSGGFRCWFKDAAAMRERARIRRAALRRAA